MIIEPGNNDPVQVFLNLFGGIHALRPHQPIDKQKRLNDLDIENTESPQPHKTEFRILKGNRVSGAPLQVGKNLHICKIDLGAEWAGERPGQAGDFCENGDVGCFQGMATRSKGFNRFAFIKENGRLALSDRELRAEFDLTRTLFRDAVNQLPA